MTILSFLKIQPDEPLPAGAGRSWGVGGPAKNFAGFCGKQVLDLGCGYGWHCVYAAERGASHVTGVDLSEKMLDTARKRLIFPRWSISTPP